MSWFCFLVCLMTPTNILPCLTLSHFDSFPCILLHHHELNACPERWRPARGVKCPSRLRRTVEGRTNKVLFFWEILIFNQVCCVRAMFHSIKKNLSSSSSLSTSSTCCTLESSWQFLKANWMSASMEKKSKLKKKKKKSNIWSTSNEFLTASVSIQIAFDVATVYHLAQKVVVPSPGCRIWAPVRRWKDHQKTNSVVVPLFFEATACVSFVV